MVKVQDGFSEVKMKGKAVSFLVGLNKDQRNDTALDLPFIKAIIICVFGVKKVKSGDTLESELIAFINGMKRFLFFSF